MHDITGTGPQGASFAPEPPKALGGPGGRIHDSSNIEIDRKI